MKKVNRLIRRLVDAVVICFFIFSFSPISGSDNITTSDPDNLSISTIKPLQTWTLSITEDGQLQINGKPVERMSDPEIKAAVKEMATAMKKQAENDELVRYYDRQTSYLLRELEKCLKSR